MRWIEAVIACPVFTSMAVYYIEGMKEHLLNTELGQQKRTFAVPAMMLGALTFCAVIGSLVIAVLLLLVKRAEERGIFDRLYHDATTGLYNKKHLGDVLAKAKLEAGKEVVVLLKK